MKKILIRSPKYGDHYAIVDDSDFDLVSKYRWTLEKGRTSFYALHTSGGYWYKGETIKRGVTFRMHQLILGIKPKNNGKRSQSIDHIDHDGLNNQRNNIRICTNSQNRANAKLQRTNNSTGYKGVTKRTKTNGMTWRYISRIRVNDKLIQIGSFDTPEDAAKAYNHAAINYFGEFAYLNQV
jgi:hypothetical protein